MTRLAREETCLRPSLLFQIPLDEVLGDEAHHAEGQAQKNDEGAQLSGLGLPRQMADDEHHVEHESCLLYTSTLPTNREV